MMIVVNKIQTASLTTTRLTSSWTLSKMRASKWKKMTKMMILRVIIICRSLRTWSMKMARTRYLLTWKTLLLQQKK